MAYYRTGKVIKMRRNALGHSREEYGAEGPSYQTIYRLENGKVHIKERTYRQLSRAMGEEESTKQGILQTADMSVLWLTNEISKCLFTTDYERAEELIHQMEKKLDTSVEKNRRYLEYIKAYSKYYKGELDGNEYKNAIETSLWHENKGFDELIKSKWPFSERECNRILSMVEVMRRKKEYEKQKELLDRLIELLNAKYMDMEYNSVYLIAARYRMGDVLGNTGLHREAIALDEETIVMCEKQQDWRFLPELNYDIYWNYMVLKEKETLTKQEETHSKECLLKAYYLGKIMTPDNTLYERRILEHYQSELLVKE